MLLLNCSGFSLHVKQREGEQQQERGKSRGHKQADMISTEGSRKGRQSMYACTAQQDWWSGKQCCRQGPIRARQRQRLVYYWVLHMSWEGATQRLLRTPAAQVAWASTRRRSCVTAVPHLLSLPLVRHLQQLEVGGCRRLVLRGKGWSGSGGRTGARSEDAGS